MACLPMQTLSMQQLLHNALGFRCIDAVPLCYSNSVHAWEKAHDDSHLQQLLPHALRIRHADAVALEHIVLRREGLRGVVPAVPGLAGSAPDSLNTSSANFQPDHSLGCECSGSAYAGLRVSSCAAALRRDWDWDTQRPPEEL